MYWRVGFKSAIPPNLPHISEVNISNSGVQKLREKSPQRSSETWSLWIFVLCTDVFVESCLQKSDIGFTKKAATSPSSLIETPCRPSIPHLPPLSHWPSTEHDEKFHIFGGQKIICLGSQLLAGKKYGDIDGDGVSIPSKLVSWKFHIPQVYIWERPRINTPTQKVQAIFLGVDAKKNLQILRSAVWYWNIREKHQTKNTEHTYVTDTYRTVFCLTWFFSFQKLVGCKISDSKGMFPLHDALCNKSANRLPTRKRQPSTHPPRALVLCLKAVRRNSTQRWPCASFCGAEGATGAVK